MFALLDRLYELEPASIEGAFAPALAQSREQLLQRVCAVFVEVAFRLGPDILEAQATPEPRCGPLFAEGLRRFLAPEDASSLPRLGDLLVWSGEGILEGALRRPDCPRAEAERGLLAVWVGIASGWTSPGQ
jgi:hypothetical protein